MLDKYKVILWDFDGVIMDSMPVRELGFREVLKAYPKDQVEQLVTFHLQNGGLSRYVKFRYFFEEVRKESVLDEQINVLSESFSDIMLSLLLNEKLLIQDTVEFIKNNHQRFRMHIVSGSDGKELKYICDQMGLSAYFHSIHGSPTPKKELVRNLLLDNGYITNVSVLIGDSINDYDAAESNNIAFLGYNNPSFCQKEIEVINQFSDLDKKSDVKF